MRDAVAGDAAACAAVYAPYVLETAVSFETEPPSAAEMAERMAAAHVWLVLEQDGEVVGYAYGAPFRGRAAYAWTVEVSVYLAPGRTGRGGGRALYEPLLDRLTGRGFRTAVAGMTLPNAGSLGLHRSLGFKDVGTYRRVGWKRGSWHDVKWVQRPLVDDDDPPMPLR